MYGARINAAIVSFFGAFNRMFDRATESYGRMVAGLLRITSIVLLVYGGLMALTWLGFRTVPVGFIPSQDKGYLVVNVQLPDGASLERTEKMVQQLDEIIRATPGVKHTIGLPGYSILTSNNSSNAGGFFVILDSFHERGSEGRTADLIAAAK